MEIWTSSTNRAHFDPECGLFQLTNKNEKNYEGKLAEDQLVFYGYCSHCAPHDDVKMAELLYRETELTEDQICEICGVAINI